MLHESILYLYLAGIIPMATLRDAWTTAEETTFPLLCRGWSQPGTSC